jgi:hypothetical protein
MTPHAIYIKISQGSVLIPIIVGLIYYKALTRPFKVLFYFFIVSFLFEIQASLAAEIFHNNMPGQHLFTIVEFMAFSAVYYLHSRRSIARYLIIINAIVFMGIAIAGVVSKGINMPNDLARGYSTVSLIIFTLIYFYHLFTIDDTRYMWEYPMFWVCVGMLIYFAGSVLYIMIRSELIHNVPLERNYADLHRALNIIAYCLYAQSFRCLGKQKITQ